MYVCVCPCPWSVSPPCWQYSQFQMNNDCSNIDLISGLGKNNWLGKSFLSSFMPNNKKEALTHHIHTHTRPCLKYKCVVYLSVYKWKFNEIEIFWHSRWVNILWYIYYIHILWYILIAMQELLVIVFDALFSTEIFRNRN